ncbi:tetraacyldisaccharide 4'-kinase [Botrimarina hoheduenensis]|uniref:Tetraacyldisaccharide 4'-kinase n=1 Tax=Botrimarina hoheduenensis TaxID=2528000 RepID=A0A5C5VY47_9BACT|nr:tetraacyldisaccharide 4'-kinase [Botrimarina hoheduenensis]TWT42462.1 Tetraacyldisaccharide 4'-kinase [Botrimarina hoheduenensis]
MRASDFYELVSGRRRGLAAAAARVGLALLEGPYRLGVWWRNRRYDRQPAAVRRVGVPVISVGNLTLGGTGKTPMVRWVARRLRANGVRVAIVSRGYGASAQGPNDEALELEQSLPDVPHLQNVDRVTAAEAAINELATQAVVLDDGFQHRRLARDLDIVLIDATAPYGFGHLFPRGTLREPLGSLKRADVVCLTRANLVDAAARLRIRERLQRLAPHTIWCEAEARPTRLLEAIEDAGPYDDAVRDVAEARSLAGCRVVAFSAIGNPAAFYETLQSLDAQVLERVEFPDHHRFTADDIARLAALAERLQPEALVCTHKDLVKVGVATLGPTPLRAVAIDVVLTVGEADLTRRLEAIAQQALADDPWQEQLAYAVSEDKPSETGTAEG